jgi:hypothetical protein
MCDVELWMFCQISVRSKFILAVVGLFKFKKDMQQQKDQKISLEQSIACFSVALNTVLFCYSVFFELLANCN